MQSPSGNPEVLMDITTWPESALLKIVTHFKFTFIILNVLVDAVDMAASFKMAIVRKRQLKQETPEQELASSFTFGSSIASKNVSDT